MRFNTILAFCLLVLITSCTKEKVIAPDYSWKSLPGFQLADKVVFNSFATDKKLYLYGPAIFATLDSNHQMETPVANWYNSFIKQPIGKDFFIELSKPYNFLILKATRNPAGDRSQFGVNFAAIDTSFRSLALEYFYNTSQVAVISSENQFLIPAFTRADNYGNPTFYQVGVQVKPNLMNRDVVDTTFVRKLILKNTGSLNGEVYGLHSYYGKFFVSLGSSTFLIRADGSYNKVLDDRTKLFFEHQQNLYALGYNTFYQSTDMGETWRPAYNGSFGGGAHRGFNISEDAFVFNADKIAMLQLTSDGITSKELVNDGLEGNQITSVTRFRDRVYVTTLSGVFYKPYEHFLTFKEDK
jgi:hypothetical protein